MGVEEHRSKAMRSLNCAVLTISDTRNKGDDDSGRLILDMLKGEGHRVEYYEVVIDNINVIRAEVSKLAYNDEIQVVVTNGGTGIGKRDFTIEALTELFDKTLPGFGELFRWLSYKEVGGASMLSRSVAGVVRGTLVFSLPGSVNAVRTGMSLLIKELGHMVWEISR